MNHRKTFIKSLASMLVSYLFAVTALGLFIKFIHTVFYTEMNDATAAYSILGAMFCTIMTIATAKYSEKVERSFDKEAYNRLRNNSSERV